MRKLVSDVAIHEAGHCIAAFDLGFKIINVSISGETGRANIEFTQILPSKKVDEILRKASLAEMLDFGREQKKRLLDKMLEKAKLDKMLEKAKLDKMLEKAKLDKMLEKAKLDKMLEQKHISLNEILEDARAKSANISEENCANISEEEIAAAINYDELVKKSHDAILDVLLAGWAAEYSFIKDNRMPAPEMFANPGALRRDSSRELGIMEERAKDDLKRYTEIIRSRKERIDSIDRASIERVSSDAKIQNTYANLLNPDANLLNLDVNLLTLFILKPEPSPYANLFLDENDNTKKVRKVSQAHFETKIQKATLLRLAREIDSKRELSGSQVVKIIIKKPKKLGLF
jgi:hypothetical protein